MRGRRAIDLTGQRFGRVIAVAFKGTRNGRGYWECLCDCGKSKTFCTRELRAGDITSCGCERKERATKHGLYYTREHRIWIGMKSRCSNAKMNNYKWYGGKGIKVCKEWSEDFKTFYEWAHENGYQDNLTIDRIDGNGDYEPKNCRWITIQEQQRNKTN